MNLFLLMASIFIVRSCDKAVLCRDWCDFLSPQVPSPRRFCNRNEILFPFSALWDQLLEGRIKLQKALLTTNQLPQPDVFPIFKDKGGPEFASALKNSKNTYASWGYLEPLGYIDVHCICSTTELKKRRFDFSDNVVQHSFYL